MLEECLLTAVQCQSKRRRRMEDKVKLKTMTAPGKGVRIGLNSSLGHQNPKISRTNSVSLLQQNQLIQHNQILQQNQILQHNQILQQQASLSQNLGQNVDQSINQNLNQSPLLTQSQLLQQNQLNNQLNQSNFQHLLNNSINQQNQPFSGLNQSITNPSINPTTNTNLYNGSQNVGGHLHVPFNTQSPFLNPDFLNPNNNSFSQLNSSTLQESTETSSLLTAENRALINQISVAYQAYQIPEESPMNFSQNDNSVVPLKKTGEVHAEAFIKFSKKLPGYVSLSCDDQITGGNVEKNY